MVELLPPQWKSFIIGDEGRDRIVERFDDTSFATFPIQRPDVGSHSIRTSSTVNRIHAANNEICVVVHDSVVVMVFEE
jgi:hypothetical protein